MTFFEPEIYLKSIRNRANFAQKWAWNLEMNTKWMAFAKVASIQRWKFIRNFSIFIWQVEYNGELLASVRHFSWRSRTNFNQWEFCRFLISGLCCVSAGILPDEPELEMLRLILLILGKMGCSGAFATCYVYTSELFPTPIRTTSVGFW